MHSNQTLRFKLSFLKTYQAQKEVLVNANSNKIDLLMNRGIKSYTQAIPPEVCYGDLFIVPTSASSQQHCLALFTDIWEFIEPTPGMIFFAEAEREIITYYDQMWHPIIKIDANKEDQRSIDSQIPNTDVQKENLPDSRPAPDAL